MSSAAKPKKFTDKQMKQFLKAGIRLLALQNCTVTNIEQRVYLRPKYKDWAATDAIVHGQLSEPPTRELIITYIVHE
jgi:hypothetical protein